MLRALLPLLLVLPAAAAPAPGYETFARLHDRLMGGAAAEHLEDELPGLSENVKIARGVSEKHWTDCTVFDELAKADILSETAMKGLGIRRETTAGIVHAPAGLMHTYGYLFSQLKTAYGLKGKRWIESRLDERLGLPAGTFGPLPPKGEFASNVTAALLRLAGEKARLERAAKLAPAAKPLGRVEQHVAWKTPEGATVEAAVLTYLVPLGPAAGLESADRYLLIYAVRRDRRLRLTTAFPVAQGFADAIMATKPDEEPAFKPRFNLFVDPAWTVASQRNLGWIAGR